MAKLTLVASATSLASTASTAQFPQKTSWLVWSSPAPKWPILVPFCGMDHQKSNFSLILAVFLSEAVEASRCYFFENWWMKLKCPLLLKPLATIVQENSQSFYPSEPFRISHFTMRHPVYHLQSYHYSKWYGLTHMLLDFSGHSGNYEKELKK